jgi:hypothetical protein
MDDMAGFYNYANANSFDFANYDGHSVEHNGAGMSILYQLHMWPH